MNQSQKNQEKISDLLEDIKYEYRNDTELEDTIREGLQLILKKIKDIKKFRS